jgi:signal transduction histidine kinase
VDSTDRGRPLIHFTRRFWLWLFGLATAIGLLQFSYFYLADLTEGVQGPWLDPFLSEMSGAYGVALLFPGILWLTRRVPFASGNYRKAALASFGGLVVFSLLHTSWMWLSRTLLWPVAGLGSYDYGIMPIRYFMEFPSQAISYGMMVALITFYDRNQEASRRALQVSNLEAQLAVAHLHNLKAQVQPHFLFNALNTVSSVMYEDLAQADRVIAALADLLRRTMQDAGRVRVPLREEVDLLERYLEIMKARFGDRLDASIAVEPGLDDALVPSLLLQPLVENAMKHGDAGEGETLRVRVLVARDEDSLCLEVEDNGPGSEATGRELLGRGLGLSNTAERLETLYGAEHGLVFGRGPQGGLSATVRLPLERASSAVDLAQAMP